MPMPARWASRRARRKPCPDSDEERGLATCRETKAGEGDQVDIESLMVNRFQSLSAGASL